MKPAHILWSGREAAPALHGWSTREWNARGVQTRSGDVQAGDLFFACDGEKQIPAIEDALSRGACACVVSGIPAGLDTQGAFVVVDDPADALCALGEAARQRFGGVVSAACGEGAGRMMKILAAALSSQGWVHQATEQGAQDSEPDISLSLARLPAGADYGVFALSPESPRQSAACADIPYRLWQMQPDLFLALDGAAAMDPFEGLTSGTMILLDRDSSEYPALRRQAESCGIQKIYTFGYGAGASARVHRIIEAENGLHVTGEILRTPVSFHFPATDARDGACALAALLMVRLAGGRVDKALEAFAWMQAEYRESWQKAKVRRATQGGVRLLDPQTNPVSALQDAAFRVMAMIDPGHGRRRIAVLGGDVGGRGVPRDMSLPLRVAGLDILYTCAGRAPVPSTQKRKAPETLAAVVPEVLTPGDVLRITAAREAWKPAVEALRTIPKSMMTGVPCDHVI